MAELSANSYYALVRQSRRITGQFVDHAQKAEFVAKVGVVVEEADETVFWLELCSELGLVGAVRIQGLLKEANELLAIVAASQRTARANRNK